LVTTNNYPAWHNGKFCQQDSLSISVHDFGLLRSYGVYDVVTVKNNRALSLDQHLNRFLSGCKYYRIDIQYSASDIMNVIKELNQQCNEDIHVWLIATRGIPASNGISDIIQTTPEVMLMVSPYTRVNQGWPMKLGVARTVKRIPDESINQCYKNFARQDFTMAQIEVILDRGFHNAILLDSNGYLTEGPQFNIAIIKDGQVLSPAQNRLAGVTMETVRLLCEENNIVFKYSNITESVLRQADDAFATTTAGGIIPIAAVDDKQFIKTPLQDTLRSLYAQAWTQDQYSTRI